MLNFHYLTCMLGIYFLFENGLNATDLTFIVLLRR